MKTKSIGVRKLKDNLSGYLKEVESGAVILVSDRDRIIAEIHEPRTDLHLYGLGRDPLLASWTKEGRLILPKTEKISCPASPMKSPGVNSLKLINEERGE